MKINNSDLNFSEIHARIEQLKPSPENELSAGEDIWLSLLSKQMSNKLGLSQIHGLKYLIGKYQIAVAEARIGKLNVAEQHLRESSRLTKGFKKDEESLIKVFALPARAYLYYRRYRYDKALKDTLAAMIEGERLEKYGYPIFHFHRIQQMHNVCRIYFKINEIPTAILSSKELLEYLMKGLRPLSFKGKWDQNLTDLAPPALRSALIMQVIQETHFTWMNMSEDETTRKQNFMKFFEGLHKGFTPITKEDNSLNNWFNSKEQFYAGEFESFVKRSLDFLEIEPVQFDSFKYSLINDLVFEFSRLENNSSSKLLVQSLKEYAKTKLKVKSRFNSSIIN